MPKKNPDINQEALEEKIQEEIRKRILKEGKRRDSARNAEDSTNATLDALEDMVSLSREEMEQIAEAVRREFTGAEDKPSPSTPQKSGKRNRWFMPWTVICILLVALMIMRRGHSWRVMVGFLILVALGLIVRSFIPPKDE